MTMRRQRREDPAYLTAMREAKELFDAEMAKNSMKGRGRPKTVVAVAPVAAAEVAIDHEEAHEIADLAGDGVEAEELGAEELGAEELDAEVKEVAPPKAAKSSATSVTKSAVKSSSNAATRAVKKPAAKKKAAPAKKPAARKR